MKRILALLLALLLLAAASGCTNSYTKDLYRQQLRRASGQLEPAFPDTTLQDGFRLTETQLVDRNGITITAYSIDEDESYIYLNLLIRNDTEAVADLSCGSHILINGWSARGYLNTNIVPGGVEDTQLYFEKESLPFLDEQPISTISADFTYYTDDYSRCYTLPFQLELRPLEEIYCPESYCSFSSPLTDLHYLGSSDREWDLTLWFYAEPLVKDALTYECEEVYLNGSDVPISAWEYYHTEGGAYTLISVSIDSYQLDNSDQDGDVLESFDQITDLEFVLEIEKENGSTAKVDIVLTEDLLHDYIY